MSMRTAHVVVASTRAATGTYTDRSGPIAVEFLRSLGFDTPDATVVADAELEATIDQVLADPPKVLLTSGGTGLTPDDRTVDIIQPRLERELPGVVQAFFIRGLENTPTAIVSRAVAGTIGSTFVMTLPGSTGGVKDGCAVLADVLEHIVDLLEGHHGH